MAEQQAPGGHYSGRNPVPTVKKFIENLDKDKAERDRKLDQQNASAKKNTGEAVPHRAQKMGVEGTATTVTDPTTGREVVIEDVSKAMMDQVENPQVRQYLGGGCALLTIEAFGPQRELEQRHRKFALGCIPMAYAYIPQPIKTDPSQSQADYKHNQDVTAPPDPVAEGTTSDVPIHGEKTNILFHPTPSVSYEPTFAALEKKAGFLCIGILVVTVVIGKMFGGALKGLIPLAMCLSSGVWLWVKEVIRSGREVEWDSEQTRGQMVIFPRRHTRRPLTRTGNRKSSPRVRRVDEHTPRGHLGPNQPRHVPRYSRHSRRCHASLRTGYH